MDLIITIAALVAVFFIGGAIERRHFANLAQREAKAPKIPFVNVGKRTAFKEDTDKVELLMGSAVVGADYFKYFMSGLISIFGGRIGALESVMDRARREAALRLREKAITADFITNVRYETCTLTGRKSRSIPKVEVMAYGTAVYLKK